MIVMAIDGQPMELEADKDTFAKRPLKAVLQSTAAHQIIQHAAKWRDLAASR